LRYDLAILNGHIIDGTGRKRFKSNVYLEEGKIAKISLSGPKFGDNVIDAKGLIVCPGFVDMHSHSDLTIWKNRRVESLIHQGITTVYFTPDGWSPAPVVEEHRKDLIEYFETLTFGASIPFTWSTYDDYFIELEKNGISVNARANVGFGTVRINAMGFDMRAPTSAEMEHMKEMFDQAFKDGVCGISTGLVYYPQCYSTTEELLELMKVAAKYRGIHHTHTREGTEGIKEAIELSERSGVPVHITHTTPSDEQFYLIEGAKARGVDITFDAHPYTAGSSFLSGIYFPGWVHEGGPKEMLKRIQQPQVRERIAKEWRERPPKRWPNGQRGKPIIAWCQNENYRKFEGKTLNQIADMMDLDIIDTFCILVTENKGNIMYVGLKSYIHRNVKRAYQHSLFLVGSDAWAMAPYGPLHIGYPHPRCYGTYPKILGKFIRHLNLLTMEDAIRKMTWNPAQRILIKDRGALVEGMAADITIFDPNRVIDNATYLKPHLYPSGIEYVIVNGKVTIDKGEHTGALEGKVLRYRSKDG
jgi:N-acyl-D-amino-acid deacylase